MKFEINDLYKKYKTFCLDNVSFTMESGSIVGLIGVNGAGKSTILRILVGLTTKDSGEILADGQKISNISEKLRVGFVSQNLDIYKDQKMSSVATFVKDVYKSMWDDDLYKKYLYDVFKLTDDLKIKELSTGMRVKFFLALELAKNPECLLLDEVTSGLDPMVRDEVLDILIDIAQEKNIPILLSSHITEDLEKIANHIVYIDNGRILLEDSVETLRSNYFKIDEEEIKELDEESRQIILEKGIKQHQYYIYDVSLLGDYKKAGSAALLSDILPYLRKK